MNCDFCDHMFSSMAALLNHQHRAKYCLKIQEELDMDISGMLKKCDFCPKEFAVNNIEKHQDGCKHNPMVNKDKLADEIKRLSAYNIKLESDLKMYKDQADDIKRLTSYTIKLESELKVYKEQAERATACIENLAQQNNSNEEIQHDNEEENNQIKPAKENTSKDEEIHIKEQSENSSSSTSEVVDFVLFLSDNTSISVPVNTKTGYINVTKICKAVGKDFYDWRRIKEANEIISALERSLQIPGDLLIINITTGLNGNRGTFSHRLLAIPIACWTHPNFSCQVAAWSEELFLTGKVILGQETKIINNLDDTLINNSNETTFQLTLPNNTTMVIPIKNGRINATVLCKAGNKEYSKWIRNKNSEDTLLALEKYLQLSRDQIITTVTTGPNDQRGTFVNRKLGIIIAMWINPDFFIQIASWIDELLITGSVTIGKEKPVEEIDSRLLHLQIQSQEKDDIIVEKNNTINNLKKSVYRYEKVHRFVQFGVEQPAYYAFSFGRRCTEDCHTKKLIKHGITVVDKINFLPLDSRLRSHRTSIRWLYVEFAITCPYVDAIKMLEDAQEIRFKKYLNPSSSEVFEGVSVELLKNTAKAFLELLCPGNVSEIPQEKIDEYNKDVDDIIIDDTYIEKLEILSTDSMKTHLPNLTLEHVNNGPKGYATFALEGPFKDKVVCTDISRKILKYRDENKLIQTDQGGIALGKKFFQTVQPRSIEILMKEQEEISNNTEIDAEDRLAKMMEIAKEIISIKSISRGDKEGEEYREDFTKYVSSGTVMAK